LQGALASACTQVTAGDAIHLGSNVRLSTLALFGCDFSFCNHTFAETFAYFCCWSSPGFTSLQLLLVVSHTFASAWQL
jgi:hypothetical protein